VHSEEVGLGNELVEWHDFNIHLASTLG